MKLSPTQQAALDAAPLKRGFGVYWVSGQGRFQDRTVQILIERGLLEIRREKVPTGPTTSRTVTTAHVVGVNKCSAP